MKLKQPKSGAKLSLKATLKNKNNRTKEKHKRKRHLQKKNNLTT